MRFYQAIFLTMLLVALPLASACDLIQPQRSEQQKAYEQQIESYQEQLDAYQQETAAYQAQMAEAYQKYLEELNVWQQQQQKLLEQQIISQQQQQ